MSNIHEFFQKGTNATDSYLQINNVPVKTSNDEFEFDNSEEQLYWEFMYSGVQITTPKENANFKGSPYTVSLFVNFISPLTKVRVPLDFLEVDYKVRTDIGKCTISDKGAFIFNEMKVYNANPLLVHMIMAFERKLVEFAESYRSTVPTILKKECLIKTVLYTDQESGNTSITNIKFPQTPMPNVGRGEKPKPCSCLPEFPIYKTNGGPCFQPVEVIASDKCRKPLDIKDAKLLEKESKLRFRREMHEKDEKGRKDYLNDFNQVEKELSTNSSNKELKLKYDLMKKRIEILDEIVEETRLDALGKIKEEYLQVEQEIKDTKITKLCAGTINSVLIKDCTTMKFLWHITSGQILKSDGSTKLKLSCDLIRFAVEAVKKTNVDDEYA